MQRLYSMFPEGGPGVGLLLLRLCVAGTLALLPVVPWLHVALVLLAACIAAGVITSISCVLALLVVAASLVESGSHAGSAVADLLLIVAVILLGPGAYSIDARLFGRRELVLPPRGGPPS